MGDSTRVPQANSLYRISLDGRFRYRCVNGCFFNCQGDDYCRGDRQYIICDANADPILSEFFIVL